MLLVVRGITYLYLPNNDVLACWPKLDRPRKKALSKRVAQLLSPEYTCVLCSAVPKGKLQPVREVSWMLMLQWLAFLKLWSGTYPTYDS